MVLVSHSHGFSLLEMAVVLAVIALIISMSMSMGSMQIQKTRIQTTKAEMDMISRSLTLYAEVYHRLPCPMPNATQPGDAGYGFAHTACTSADAAPAGMDRIEHPAGKYIRMGAVPFRDLQLPNDMIKDGWGNRYLYAVSEEAIQNLDHADAALVSIIDSSDNTITDEAVYALVSYGINGNGAVEDEENTVVAACNAAMLEGTNCTLDGTFRESQFTDSDSEANYFDDFIDWRSISSVVSHTGSNL